MGWTLDYTEWNLDIPRLADITAYWNDCPPAPVQLARIAARLGIGTGKDSPRGESGASPPGSWAPNDMSSLMENMPQGDAPVFISAAEFRKKKEADHG